MGLLGRFGRGGASAKVDATLAAVEDLLRSDRGSPRDEPRAEDARYLGAARILRTALDQLTEAERQAPMMGGRLWNELGGTLSRQWPGFAEEALRAHLNAVATAPENANHWYDLGLCHKYAGRFADGVEANRRSLRLCGGDEGSLWNLGICATGAGDWAAAREAWEGLKIEIEEVESEIHTKGAGVVQVRVSERGPIVAPREGHAESFEYLWMARLGPAHGRILSPTVGNLVVDVGDVVLHDGAAAGYRVDGKRKVPRFPLMALLRRRTNHVFRFAGAQPGRGAIAALEEKLGAGSVYVHTEEVAWLCRECARGGKAGHQHEQLKPDARIVYGKLVIEEGRLATFREALDGALRARDDLALYCPELHRALGDEARAGADQEAWTALAYS